MSNLRHVWCCAWVLVCIHCSIHSVMGQEVHEARPVEYARLVQDAVTEFNAGKWAEARALFERAHELQPNARSFRGLGLSAIELRRYAEAAVELRAALEDERQPLTAELRPQVEEALQRALNYVGVVDIHLEPANASVLLDGRKVAAIGLRLSIGDYRLQASAPGYHPTELALHVNGDKHQSVELSLTPIERHGEHAHRLREPTQAGSGWQGPVGWVAVSAGGIGIVMSGVFGLLHSSALEKRRSICPSSLNCSVYEHLRVEHLTKVAEQHRDWALVSLAVGGTFVLGGVLLWFSKPAGQDKALTVQPALGLDVVGARISGHF